ncbi:hypothetical protein JOB18_031162 [Solea senegalensis]|uniref:Secreted protein n=1 Tax=Solea senegalensis TaxID=28829 RepID=A0AAV6QD52_SOLSE|nr:hypothetical protein JOB18_031162 [Solea senegalensis]
MVVLMLYLDVFLDVRAFISQFVKRFLAKNNGESHNRTPAAHEWSTHLQFLLLTTERRDRAGRWSRPVSSKINSVKRPLTLSVRACMLLLSHTCISHFYRLTHQAGLTVDRYSEGRRPFRAM